MQNLTSTTCADASNFDKQKDQQMKEKVPETYKQRDDNEVLHNVDSRNFLKNSRGEVFENNLFNKTGDPREDHSIAQIGVARDSGESLAYAPARKSDQY